MGLVITIPNLTVLLEDEYLCNSKFKEELISLAILNWCAIGPCSRGVCGPGGSCWAHPGRTCTLCNVLVLWDFEGVPLLMH